MKKVFSLLTMFLLVLSSFANNTIHSSKKSNIINLVNESKNYVIVEIKINKITKEYKYSYKSEKELYNIDFESILTRINKDFNNALQEEECTIHVSFTVSAGYDSSYVSLTVSGDFPCETWKADARKLKQDALDLIM